MTGDLSRDRDDSIKGTTLIPYLCILVPFIVFAHQTLQLDNWIIDDAGISFSYARNLAHGFGLVSQPGMQPVEGFSNPLWVFLLAPFFSLGIFDPVITPKLLALLCVLVGFIAIGKIFRKLTEGPLFPVLVTLSLLACNTPFVVWTSSGLENGLYFALGMLLLLSCVRAADAKLTTAQSVTAGLLIAGMALTRPEGIAYLLLFLCAVLVRSENETLRAKMLSTVPALLTVALLAGGYELFRWFYFCDWLPNTAYVKGTPGSTEIIGLLTLDQNYLLKYRDLCASVFGAEYWVFPDIALLISAIVLCMLYRSRKVSGMVLIPVLMTFLAAGLFLAMTLDWMREFRFATLYYPALYISLVMAASIRINRFRSTIVRVAFSIIFALFSLYIARTEHEVRLTNFAAAPTVPMAQIRTRYVERFDHIAAHLKLDSTTVLLPDLGATLYYSPFRTYDFAGLTDRSIAKLRGVDQSAFYNYIFDTIRPTIINSYGFFTSVSHLELDLRFARDYVPIRDSLEPYWETQVLAGDYVRRDAVISKDSHLAALQRGETPWDQVSPGRN